MPYREVRIYDRDFPSMVRIMVGDLTVKDDWPQEVWKTSLGKDEFAVVFRHFQTSGLLMPDGSRAGKQGEELCLIFDNRAEACQYSSQLVRRSAHTICFIYNDDGVEVERIQNDRFLTKFGIVFWLGILVWMAFFCAIGLGVIFGIYELFRLMSGSSLSPIGSFRMWSWVLCCSVGLLLGLAVCLARLFFKARTHANALRKKLSRQEWDRYEQELETLRGSSNPEDHARYAEIWNEMQRKLRS